MRYKTRFANLNTLWGDSYLTDKGKGVQYCQSNPMYIQFPPSISIKIAPTALRRPIFSGVPLA